MSINLTRYTVLSREQFTQEFLPTMTPAGTYFTWEQVNCNERPDDVTATQVWTIYRQDDGSMIAFNRPAIGANEVGYVICAEDYTDGNDLLAAHWWPTAARANSEIHKWARQIARTGNVWGYSWAAKVLGNATVLSDTRPFALMSEEEFAEEYQPYMRGDGNYYEAADIRHVNRQHVWTVFDGDKGGLIARAGLIVEGNPIGYLTTVVPWDSLGQRAIWSTPVDSLVCAAESKTPLNGFRSNITFGKQNGWKPGPTAGSSYRVLAEDSTERRLHDLEIGDVSQDEVIEHLEQRVGYLEAADVCYSEQIHCYLDDLAEELTNRLTTVDATVAAQASRIDDLDAALVRITSLERMIHTIGKGLLMASGHDCI